MIKINSFEDLEAHQKKVLDANKGKKVVSICSGTGCHAYGSEKIFEALSKELDDNELTDQVIIKRSGCHGFCERGPIVFILPYKYFYISVKPEDAKDIVENTIIKGETVKHLLWSDSELAAKEAKDIPFYKHQTRLVLENNTFIDPANIDDYIAHGGYTALKKVLSGMSPDAVLDEVKKANVRGRGGGGFPAGAKWETAKNASGSIKYVVVNGDEGDPGAFMDRSILEGNPHSVIEGLMIGAYAIGAQKGFFYVRQEYPLALKNTLNAIRQAEEYGLLGKNIFGTDFSFEIYVHRGAGAFVSGESSALMSAIEGKPGEPRLKYIRTSVKGLWEKPTNLNNVETWANIPLIIKNGAEWFTKIGTEHSKGTKIFSLVGKVKNTGLVEVPMGITLRSIIYDIGGGIKNNKKFKAVQIGGPSGGCLPEKYLDVPVDFDALTELGAMMGSGGLIVMDEDSCMVDVARYFLEFLKDESCGKCMPCREGVTEMLTILNKIASGNGRLEYLDFLEDISDMLSEACLCALGSTAPNPILSTVKYFKEEYEDHIINKKCSALACKDLISYTIDAGKCIGCGVCAKNCPVGAISGENKKSHIINQDRCTKCGICLDVCPKKIQAVGKVSPVIKSKIALATAGQTE